MAADIRWNDREHVPLTNGPARIVTPPIAPRYALDSDGKAIEYLVPFPMHIIDNTPWQPLHFIASGVPVSIQRPVSIMSPYEPEGRLGNESPDAYCTILRVRTPLNSPFGAEEGWKMVEKLLDWIRIKCRHYWLLHGITGFAAHYRGSVFARNGRIVSQQNIATYGRCMIVRPLTESLWLTMRQEVEANAETPLADSVYCDALLSAVAGNEKKALLEAGVAAEVAITQLLTEVADIAPNSSSKTAFRKKQNRLRFGEKLTEWPQRFGLDPASGFRFEGMPNDWATMVQHLYKLRNGVAHSGTLNDQATSIDVTSSIFAVNALLHYCEVQRSRVGLSSYSMPAEHTAFKQLVAYHNGLFTAKTNKCEGLLP